jgi:hypothetical protein
MNSSPDPSMVLRRSPRSVAKLCKNMKMEGLTATQTSLLLSLAHCTGWSADRIRLKIKEVTDLDLTAEDIWSFHWSWVEDRGKKEILSQGEIEVMKWVLKSIKITLTAMAKPLYLTPRPVRHSLANSLIIPLSPAFSFLAHIRVIP